MHSMIEHFFKTKNKGWAPKHYKSPFVQWRGDDVMKVGDDVMKVGDDVMKVGDDLMKVGEDVHVD